MKKIFLCLLMSCCFTTSAEPLSQQRVQVFANAVVKTLLNNPSDMIEYLSDTVVVESKVGSSLNGVVLKYNKQDYAKVLQSTEHPLSDQSRYGKLRLHDVSVSGDVGEFSMSVYLKQRKYKSWLTFRVVQNAKKIEITKWVVEM